MTEADARRILQVHDVASSADIRRAYLDLVKVWHPDRFQGDARLRERAERTLQQINDAYTLLERQAAPAAPPAAESARPADVPEPGPANASHAHGTRWRYLQSPMALPVCAGLALGIAVATTLFLQSTPAADRSMASPQVSSEPAAPPELAPLAPDTSPAPRGPARPDTGSDVGHRGPIGRGILTIRSGLPTDAIVELLHEGGHRRRVYLRRGEQITLLDLVAGAHQLRFAAGTGWTGRWFTETTATVERVQPVMAAQVGPGAPVESVTLVFGDVNLRAVSPLQPD